jgi:hypothetical protein
MLYSSRWMISVQVQVTDVASINMEVLSIEPKEREGKPILSQVVLSFI